MKFFLSILSWLLPVIAGLYGRQAFSQPKDSLPPKPETPKQIQQSNSTTQSSQNKNTKSNKPEIFSSGFIDIVNSGQVNASARFIRLFIGEPGSLPIYQFTFNYSVKK